ncbi:MAG: MBL fold metallo-hydrolase [Actinobacteria bacterium]|nr:MAG: MBL fold metallo-hydrolase [Actinomycetota bacterium]REK39727.1 MAG: MBL fold metallo-hydrolase [Actinomycetota bacterium]
MRIERVLANNPGPYTGPGTNTWILDDGSGKTVIIDPGPIDSAHEHAIIELLSGRHVEAVLVTHTHTDHAPMANPIAAELSVAAIGHAPGPFFDPDERVAEGSSVPVGDISLEVIHTPGHADDHLCFRAGNVVFSGDHIIGGSSVMVERLGPYLESLRKLKGTGIERLYPGHGDEIEDADETIDWYLAHRLERHAQVKDAVEQGAGSAMEVVEIVYADVDKSLHPLARMSVEAHLVLLSEQGEIALEKDRIVQNSPETP